MKWIDIKEQQPPYNKEVIIARNCNKWWEFWKGALSFGYLDSIETKPNKVIYWFWDEHYRGTIGDVTHWVELPNLPD